MFALTQLLHRLSAQESVSLATFSTMKVGGKAKYLVNISNINELCTLQKALYEYGENYYILSGGSNTLFSDHGFAGVIIKLSAAFDYTKTLSDNNIEVGAKTSYARITKLFLSLGEQSALGWLGTPGLVGGALRMNAGSSLGVIGDVVESITGVYNGTLQNINKSELVFSYRQNSLPKDFIITSAVLKANNLCDEKELAKKALSLKQKRLLTQPREHSLGSFFKNPLPFYAGKLIEDIGLKGFSIGGAQISPVHANFIVNNAKANTSDIIKLAHEVHKKVMQKYNICLEPEIKLIGESWEFLK